MGRVSRDQNTNPNQVTVSRHQASRHQNTNPNQVAVSHQTHPNQGRNNTKLNAIGDLKGLW